MWCASGSIYRRTHNACTTLTNRNMAHQLQLGLVFAALAAPVANVVSARGRKRGSKNTRTLLREAGEASSAAAMSAFLRTYEPPVVGDGGVDNGADDTNDNGGYGRVADRVSAREGIGTGSGEAPLIGLTGGHATQSAIVDSGSVARVVRLTAAASGQARHMAGGSGSVLRSGLSARAASRLVSRTSGGERLTASEDANNAADFELLRERAYMSVGSAWSHAEVLRLHVEKERQDLFPDDPFVRNESVIPDDSWAWAPECGQGASVVGPWLEWDDRVTEMRWTPFWQFEVDEDDESFMWRQFQRYRHEALYGMFEQMKSHAGAAVDLSGWPATLFQNEKCWTTGAILAGIPMQSSSSATVDSEPRTLVATSTPRFIRQTWDKDIKLAAFNRYKETEGSLQDTAHWVFANYGKQVRLLHIVVDTVI